MCDNTNNVHKPNHNIDSNRVLGDFYNKNIDVKYLCNPQTFESYDITLLNVNEYIDDGTTSGHCNISGTGTDRHYTLKDHFNNCKVSRVLGSYKAKKYIFPKQDSKHPGYFEGKHTDFEKLEYFMGTSCGQLNNNQYQFYCKLTGRDVRYKEISKLGIPSTMYDIRHEKRKYAILHP